MQQVKTELRKLGQIPWFLVAPPIWRSRVTPPVTDSYRCCSWPWYRPSDALYKSCTTFPVTRCIGQSADQHCVQPTLSQVQARPHIRPLAKQRDNTVTLNYVTLLFWIKLPLYTCTTAIIILKAVTVLPLWQKSENALSPIKFLP